MFKATFESRNFTFEAYGETVDAALEALHKGWDEHVRQSGATIPWSEVLEDSTVQPITLGGCYRDNEPLFRVGS